MNILWPKEGFKPTILEMLIYLLDGFYKHINSHSNFQRSYKKKISIGISGRDVSFFTILQHQHQHEGDYSATH